MNSIKAIDELIKLSNSINLIKSSDTGQAMQYTMDILKMFENTPENPTNGDIIKALFPDMYFSEDVEETGDSFERTIWLVDNVYTICFDKDWWNAPYKAESEE